MSIQKTPLFSWLSLFNHGSGSKRLQSPHGLTAAHQTTGLRRSAHIGRRIMGLMSTLNMNLGQGSLCLSTSGPSSARKECSIRALVSAIILLSGDRGVPGQYSAHGSVSQGRAVPMTVSLIHRLWYSMASSWLMPRPAIPWMLDRIRQCLSWTRAR